MTDREVIILTGGTGSLGRNLTRVMSLKSDIFQLSLRKHNSSAMFGQFAELHGLRNRNIKLLHAAWPVRFSDYQSSPENKKFYELSKGLFSWFLENFEGSIIGVGSILEAGGIAEVLDNSSADPQSEYAKYKVLTQEWLSSQATGKYSWLRVGYQFAKSDPPHKLIPTLLCDSLPFLKQPHASRDYIHVSDVAEAIQALLENQMTSVMTISTGSSVSPLQIARVLGRKVQFDSHSAYSIQTTRPDNLFKTGWRPRFYLKDFERALEEEEKF